MSLRYALIALLTGRPMTGYDISKSFSRSVAHVWHAPDSQIYPELNRMERDGLLDSVEVPWGKRGTKKEYHVTEAGLAAFREWMESPLVPQRQRDPVYLKAAYFDFADPEAVREQLRQQQAYWEEQLALLEQTRATLVDRSHPTLAARISKLNEREAELAVRYKIYAYDGLIARARTELEWIKDGFALIDELYGP
ncbi:PadR family transcriptional regulator [Saccharomonospora viridis]|uniref:Predicted transcriptional regulator n=2 Tax=Saccharomonospora viridis TaxID=1852 RepID=C7N061_SACVD|nr:PadR family transcriptional regulator [Saccharomonospora viridis]ACU97597.1 predicted transcriptional regulator [Saccharomonospora viridis DSM 43017]KHF42133.1 regulatory protein [Saccharomonospora viridis]SFP48442.1 DNA-binding transcriptional regulator, PadR family [Saccharomonospora viridis]